MRLNDFVTMVESSTFTIQSLPPVTRRSRGVGISPVELNELMIDSLSRANLFTENGIYFIPPNYNSPFQNGVAFRKRMTDYEADDSHFVYRCNISIHQCANLNRNRQPNGANVAGTRQEGVQALCNAMNETHVPSITARGYEVTIRGCFDNASVVWNTDEPQWNANWYNLRLTNLVHHEPNHYVTKRRGNKFSLFNRAGQVGEIEIRPLSNWEELAALTEADMSSARMFSVKEQPYTQWIPEMKDPCLIHATDSPFQVYRMGDCDTALKGHTLNDKVKDRRALFNGSTQFLIEGIRYSLEQGVYFFAPPNLTNLDVFEYDSWLSHLSDSITITKVQTRVGFMANFSSSEEAVKSTVIKTKQLSSAKPDDDAPKFTGRANTNRLR